MSQRSATTGRPPRPSGARIAPTGPAGRQELSRHDRDQRNQRFLIIGAVVLTVLVVLILAGAWLVDTFVRAGDVAATVSGQPITTRQVADEARATVPLIEGQLRQQYGAGRPAVLAQQLEMQKRGLPEQALDAIIEQHLLQAEAARRGLTVTPEDLEARIRQSVAEFEHFSAEPEPAAEPTLEPSPPPGTTPTPVPTLEPGAFQGALRRQLERFNLSESRYRDLMSRQVLSEKVRESVASDVPATQEQVRARHILVANEEQAREVLRRLEEGADFATLAQELSTDPGSKDKGGDLGWFPRGVMNAPFQDAAFSLQPGQRSGIVSSPNGFHVIEVVERDPNRPLEPALLEPLKARGYSEWLTAQRSSAQVQRDFNASEREWVLRQIGVRP